MGRPEKAAKQTKRRIYSDATRERWFMRYCEPGFVGGYRELALEFGVSKTAVEHAAKEHNWQQRRKDISDKTRQKAENKLATKLSGELVQVGQVRNEYAAKLLHRLQHDTSYQPNVTDYVQLERLHHELSGKLTGGGNSFVINNVIAGLSDSELVQRERDYAAMLTE